MTTSPTTPLRLAVAAEIAFPGGGMTISGLRREAERGRLVIERIAGKDYVTLAAIDEMRVLCRVQPKVRDSGYSPLGGDETGPLSSLPSGVSETERSRSAQELAMNKLAALRNVQPTRSERISTKRAHRASGIATRAKS